MKNRFLCILVLSTLFVPCFIKAEMEQIKIGAPLALSGDAAQWGSAERNGILLALEEFRQREEPPFELKVIFEDTKSSQVGTTSAISKLLSIDRVQYFIGITWFDTFRGGLATLDRAKVSAILSSTSISLVNSESSRPWLFSTYHRTEHQFKEILKVLAREGYSRVALIFEQDPWWEDLRRQIMEKHKAYKIDLVDNIPTGSQEGDFRVHLISMLNKDPSAIVFGFSQQAHTLSFLQQRAQLAARIPLYSTESSCAFLQDHSELYSNVWCIAPEKPDSTFSERYRKRFEEDPIFSAANAYDAMNLYIAAFESGARKPTEISTFLRSSKFKSASFGTIEFDEMGGVTRGNFRLEGQSR